jgi:parallel beta-helix repeat protein
MKRYLSWVLATLLTAVGLMALNPAIAQADTSVVAAVDSYVDSSLPSTNFGSKSYLYADADPTRASYLTFTVPDVPRAAVRLRLFAETASRTGVGIHRVSDTGWSEGSLTYLNRPQPGPELSHTGPIAAGSSVSVDVSSVVTGPGTYSFALTTTSTTAIKFTSSEGGTVANRPNLYLGDQTGDAFTITRTGQSLSSYQATSTSGTTYRGTLKSVGESAVADLNANGGGTVQFTAGTFDFGTEYFRFRTMLTNITFVGAGRTETLVKNSTDAAADTEPFNFEGTDRLTIKDLSISAGGATRTTSDAIDFDRGNRSTVDSVGIIASRGRGIVFDGKNSNWTADFNVVTNCVIDGVSTHGVEFLASSHNRISGCTITNTGQKGIQAIKASSTADQPNKKSSDNVIVGNTVDQAGSDGIYVNSGDRNEIRNNLVTNSSDNLSGRDGIRIQSTDGISAADNVVTGNTARDDQSPKTQRYGLNINDTNCRRTIVSGNTFTGNLTGEIRNLGTDTVIS